MKKQLKLDTYYLECGFVMLVTIFYAGASLIRDIDCGLIDIVWKMIPAMLLAMLSKGEGDTRDDTRFWCRSVLVLMIAVSIASGFGLIETPSIIKGVLGIVDVCIMLAVVLFDYRIYNNELSNGKISTTLLVLALTVTVITTLRVNDMALTSSYILCLSLYVWTMGYRVWKIFAVVGYLVGVYAAYVLILNRYNAASELILYTIISVYALYKVIYDVISNLIDR